MTRVNFISRGRSFTGAHLISALELSREWGAPHNTPLANESIQPPKLDEIESIRRLCQIVDTAELSDAAEAARALCGRGDSLGGARPKSDCIDESGVLHLAKYVTSRDTLPVTRLEIATLQLAQDVGLRASKGYLLSKPDPFPIALIRRFDRDGGSRIPYISAKSFIGEDGFYSDITEQLIETSTDSFLAEAHELYRRIAFTILVNNTDDHLSNHGFLRIGDEWVLSPLFDVNPQPERHPQLKTGIHPSIGKTPSIEALIEIADAFAINRTFASKQITKMAKTLQTQWRMRCAQQGITAKELARCAPAFEHQEMDIAIKLDRVISRGR